MVVFFCVNLYLVSVLFSPPSLRVHVVYIKCLIKDVLVLGPSSAITKTEMVIEKKKDTEEGGMRGGATGDERKVSMIKEKVGEVIGDKIGSEYDAIRRKRRCELGGKTPVCASGFSSIPVEIVIMSLDY